MQITHQITAATKRPGASPSLILALDRCIQIRLKACVELPDFPIRLHYPTKGKNRDNWLALKEACLTMDIEHKKYPLNWEVLGLRSAKPISALTIVCPVRVFTEFMVDPDPERSLLVRQFRGEITDDTFQKTLAPQ